MEEINKNNENFENDNNKFSYYTWEIILFNLLFAVAIVFTLNFGNYNEFLDIDSYGILIRFISTVGFILPATLVGSITFFCLRKKEYRKKSFVITFWIAFSLSLIGSNGLSLLAKSGNYDDCMLETMKGQSEKMTSYARRSCERKYPYEKELQDYQSKLEYLWWSNSISLNLKINNNKGDYRVTKYKALFSKIKCENIKNEQDYDLKKTFYVKDGKEAIIYIDQISDNYKCMKTDKIFGIRER